MKVNVNDNCVGCGACVSNCEDVFKFNDEGYATAANENVTDENKEEVKETASICPVSAIEITE